MYLHVYRTIVVCAFITVVENKEVLQEFYRKEKYDGYNCQTTNVLFDVTSLGVTHCTMLCSKKLNCIGVYYLSDSRRCIGCSSMFDTNVKVTLVGSIFYRSRYRLLYLGCYVDKRPHRILTGSRLDLDDMTTEKCINFCMQGNFVHALTEYYWQCFCGDDFVEPINKTADSDCNALCAGNSSQTCGGGGRGSVYLV